MSKQRYNIALLPESPEFAAQCVAYARQHFTSGNQNYLLGENAHPHVTLCQFEAEPDTIQSLWLAAQRVASEPQRRVRFDQVYYLAADTSKPSSTVWTGLSAVRDTALVGLQERLYDLLSENGIVPLTQKGNGYFPHLTVARGDVHQFSRLVWPTFAFGQEGHAFSLSLGQSNEFGVYQKCLYTAQPERGRLAVQSQQPTNKL